MDFSGMDPKDARKAQRGWDLAAKYRIERAAPELLAALQDLLHVHGCSHDCAVCDEACAAIDKAKGK